MLPKKLTIKGLYSYQEEQTIDFKLLTDAGLFGIFGSVGSGKSSILEAIGFALYGKTERLNDKENRNYNMMNLKSNELIIDFEFENYDQNSYRFRVEGKRNSKRFEDVNTFKRRAFKWVNGEWLPLETTDATQILDLGYDNFRRTIIIPQGKFQDFLQLGSAERTRMMMDIFHLQKYDLSYKVKILEEENNLRMENLKGQLLTLGEKTENDLKWQEEALDTIRKEEKEHQALLDAKDNEWKMLSQLKEKFEKLHESRRELQALMNRKEEFDNRQKALEQYRQAKIYFEADFHHRNALTESIRHRKTLLHKEQATLADIAAALRQCNDEMQSLRPEYEACDTQKIILSEYDIAAEALAYQTRAHELEAAMQSDQQRISEEEKSSISLSGKITDINRLILEKKQKQPDNIFIFNEIGNWFSRYNTLLKQRDQAAQELHAIEERISKGKAIFAELDFTFDHWEQEALERKEVLERQLMQWQDQKNETAIQLELHQYATHLEDGHPCPLCGARHHPKLLAGDTEQKKKMEVIQEKITHLEQEQDRLATNRNLATRYDSKIQELQTQKDQRGQLKAELELQLKVAVGDFKWDGFDYKDEAAFRARQHMAEQDLQEIKTAETEWQLSQKQLEAAKEKLVRYQNAFLEKKVQRQNALDNFQAAKNKLHHLSENEWAALDNEKIQRLKDTLSHKITDTQQRYEQCTKQLAELEKNKAIGTSNTQNIQAEITRETTEWEALNRKIRQQMQALKMEEAQIVTLLSRNIAISQEESAIRNFQHQLFAAQKNVAEQSAELDGKSFEMQYWQELTAQLETLKLEQKKLTANIANQEQAIVDLQTKLKTKKELQKQLLQKEIRQENINELRNLFKGNGFVNYVSSVYLSNLCAAANERFMRLTRNQLRLELSGNNEFLIRDMLNDGKTRSVKTLSGGQTFQASLSLALALADSVQTQQQSEQNFFFLDEGFGSLDKEALSTIFETLKSLRKENRIVGIISHVEDLQQEIPVSLHISNDPEYGSRIRYGNL